MNATNTLTILLIDDDEGHAELARLNLMRNFITNEITHFNNGADAIDFLINQDNLNHKKYLILLDLNMPGMDGHQVLKWIKSNDDTQRIPVIILSTAAEDKEVEKAYTEGCNFFISKPMDYDAFADAIAQFGLFLKSTKIPGKQVIVTES